jgi:hypothetical protein
VCLDASKIRISGARRADVTSVGARAPLCRGIGEELLLPKSLKSGNFNLAKGVIWWMSVKP